MNTDDAAYRRTQNQSTGAEERAIPEARVDLFTGRIAAWLVEVAMNMSGNTEGIEEDVAA